MKNLRDDEIEFIGGKTYRMVNGEVTNVKRDFPRDTDSDALKYEGSDEEQSASKATSNPQTPGNNLRKGCGWGCLALIAIPSLFFMTLRFAPPEQNRAPEVSYENFEEAYEASAEVVEETSVANMNPVTRDYTLIKYITPVTDSINDVALALYPLTHTKADLSFMMPGRNDPSVMLATPAADFRADNGKIIGDFILHGTPYSEGRNRAGWVYVSRNGGVEIGAGLESFKEKSTYASENGGSIFTQHPLVVKGQAVDNDIKGKSLRRALGIFKGELYLARSLTKESIYDFANALVDYGFTTAIYLPGGNADRMIRTRDSVEYRHIDHNLRTAETPQINYILFRNDQ